MRSIKWAVAVVAASGLLGCGDSQPLIYRVAVDRLTTGNTPSSCYRAGQAPTSIPDRTTNLVDQKQWVIWEGLDETLYLEPGNINYSMGQAQRVSITGDAIVGSKNDDDQYVFTSERVQNESANETHTTTATFTIDELGKTLKGTLALRSSCSGTDCLDSPTCEVTLNFSGIQIDADREIGFGSGSGG